MRKPTDKQICIFTLALHFILIIATKLLIYSYQDGLLVLTMVALLLYFAFLLWAYRGRVIHKDVLRIYVLGVVIQALMTSGFGWVSGWLGLHEVGYLGELGFGSEFGILFYGFAMLASCGILLLIALVKWILKNKQLYK